MKNQQTLSSLHSDTHLYSQHVGDKGIVSLRPPEIHNDILFKTKQEGREGRLNESMYISRYLCEY